MIVHQELASVGQRMLWLVEHYRGGQGRLNYPLLLRLRGPLDVVVLQRALDLLVARHESLRTTFARRRGLLTQLVHEPQPVGINAVQVPPPAGEALRRLVLDEITTPIDPVTSPIRVTLWTLTDHDRLLCVNAHHLVTDAWSCRVIVNDLLNVLSGRPLARVPWQYRHFTRWQHRRSTDQLRVERDYWRDRLLDLEAPELGPVPASSGEPAGDRTEQVDIPPAAAERIRHLARTEHTTPFAAFLTIFYLLLQSECGQTDLAIASPFANRVRPEVMSTVGFFANLLVLRTGISPQLAFVENLRQTRTTVNEALSHQSSPQFLPSTRAIAGPQRRIENIAFQMLPGLPPPARIGELQVSVEPPELPSRFDLELSVLPYRGGYRALFQHGPQRIDGALVERLAAGCRLRVDALSSAADRSG